MKIKTNKYIKDFCKKLSLNTAEEKMGGSVFSFHVNSQREKASLDFKKKGIISVHKASFKGELYHRVSRAF